ncbi:WD40 repeat domain-containing protein [Sulfurimonas sp.]|nr:WD40 repeat domain-containing protein [Sulfurimonas sp.]
MKKLIHVGLIVSSLTLLVGCGGGAPKPAQAQIKKPANYEKVQAAFKDSLNVYNANSRWFQDKESLELTIIGPVYKNPIEKESEAYKKLATLLKKIAKDKTLLDKLSNSDMSKRYSKINYVPYKLGSSEDATFSAVYEQRLDSKDKLTQTLQQLDGNGVDRVGQTLAIWINPQDLKNNMYTLEGYKTVKNSTKNRNSAYYHLSKVKSNGTKNQDIVNAVLATLQLSIPEYVEIDRKDMLKQGETFRIITDNPDGTATGKVYKFDIETEVDKLNEKKKQTTDQNQIAKLDKQIKAVKASKAWREYETKQLLYTTPVSQEDINVLNRYKYISAKNIFNQLTTTDAKEISKALRYALPDPFLMVTFEQYRVLLNELGIYVGDISQVMKAYYLKGVNKLEAEKANEVLFAEVYLTMVGVNLYKEMNQVKEKEQIASFYPTSFNLLDNNGLKLAVTKQMKQLGKERLYINHDENRLDYVFADDGIYYKPSSEDNLYICNEENNFQCRVHSLKLGENIGKVKIRVSPDNKYLYISVPNKNLLHVYDNNTLKLIFTKHIDIHMFLASKNGQLHIVTNNNTLYTLDIKKKKNIFQQYLGLEKVRKIKFSRHKRYLSIIKEKNILIYDSVKNKILGDINGNSSYGVVFSDDEDLITSAPDKYTRNVYKLPSLEQLSNFKLPEKYYDSWNGNYNIPLYFDENNQLLIQIKSNMIISWDYKNNKIVTTDLIKFDSLSKGYLSINEDKKRYIRFIVRHSIMIHKLVLYDKKLKRYFFTGLSIGPFSRFSDNGKYVLDGKIDVDNIINGGVFFMRLKLWQLDEVMGIALKEY